MDSYADDPLVVVYSFRAPAGPDILARRLSDVLECEHGPDDVISPVSPGPDYVAWPRPTKLWLDEGRAEAAALVVVLVDYDRPGHDPWTTVRDARAGVSALAEAWGDTLGGGLVYASPRGARVCALPFAPVPLRRASAYLSALWAAAPEVGGLKRPDALTWTTGQRPPVVRGRPAPWLTDEVPREDAHGSLGGFCVSVGRLSWHPAVLDLPEEVRSQGDGVAPAPGGWVATPDDARGWDDEVGRMAVTLASAGARHPTLYALARRLGGWLAHYDVSSRGRLVGRADRVILGAAGTSADASRTWADGLAAGLLAPEVPPWRDPALVAFRRAARRFTPGGVR